MREGSDMVGSETGVTGVREVTVGPTGLVRGVHELPTLGGGGGASPHGDVSSPSP